MNLREMPRPNTWSSRWLCTKSRDTTGFSRVESQFLARRAALILGDTTDFSRVEFQLGLHKPKKMAETKNSTRLRSVVSNRAGTEPSKKLRLHPA